MCSYTAMLEMAGQKKSIKHGKNTAFSMNVHGIPCFSIVFQPLFQAYPGKSTPDEARKIVS
jgi:hypothetical protein